MLRWLSLWMGLEEMVKDMQQGQDMLLIAASLGLPNIIDNHVPDFFAAMLLRQETLGECCRINFGEVFVLGNGKHFLLSQTAERSTIFKRDHGDWVVQQVRDPLPDVG